MMDMKENPKVDLASYYEDRVSEEKKSTQKISILDHTNGFQYTTDDKSDSFVIDMESFSHGGFNKEINPNSRFTRSLSRKGTQRNDNHSNSKSSSLNDTNSLVPTSSPKGSCSMSEKPTDTITNQQVVHHQQQQHQITITTGNISASTETRSSSRKNSCRRSRSPCLLGPKRIFMLFATLSSLGTILLIYFTWSISKMNGDENGFLD